MTKSVNDSKSEQFHLTLTQPLSHYHIIRCELVGTPVGPTYLLEHNLEVTFGKKTSNRTRRTAVTLIDLIS